MTNAESQRKWYYNQKHTGSVYLLTIDKETYVGSTTNSLSKRLWQHKHGKHFKDLIASAKVVTIELLEQVKRNQDRLQIEQKWIEKLNPTLNQVRAYQLPWEPKGCYKGGVEYNGEWFPTKLALWEKYGNGMPLGTFKSRYHRFKGDMHKVLNFNE